MNQFSKILTVLLIGMGLAISLQASVVIGLPVLFLGGVALLWALSLDRI